MCNKIVSNTDLDESNGQCNSVHTMFCNQGNQNSYREMLALFGPPIPDTNSPTVTIDSPTAGEQLACPADFDLIITLTDDRKPQTLSTTILLDGEEVVGGPYVDQTLKFPINGGIAPGEHTWRVEIVDESDNPASAEVTFTILENPSDPTCSMVATTTTESDGSESDGTDGTASAGSTITATAGGDGDGDGDEGCACSTIPGPAPWTAAFLLVPLAIRRRR